MFVRAGRTRNHNEKKKVFIYFRSCQTESGLTGADQSNVRIPNVNESKCLKTVVTVATGITQITQIGQNQTSVQSKRKLQTSNPRSEVIQQNRVQ